MSSLAARLASSRRAARNSPRSCAATGRTGSSRCSTSASRTSRPRKPLFGTGRVLVEAGRRDQRVADDVAPQLVVPVLPHDAAQLGVEIDRRALDLIELGSDSGALVDAVHDEAGPHEMRYPDVVGDITPGVDIAVDPHADAVARIARAEDRQHQIGAAILDPPAVERLAEIPGLLLEPHLGRDVENAGQPDRAVDREAT